MSTDKTSAPVCKSCGNDTFHLVTETRHTEVVRVYVDETGELHWEHDGHEVKPIPEAEFDRRIECTSCLESPELPRTDPLHRGTVGISREVLLSTMAANPDTIYLQEALMALIDTDEEEIIAVAERQGTADGWES